MAQVQLELVRYQLSALQASVATQAEGRRVAAHGRLARQAERAERRTRCHAQAARQLRARLAELEAGI
jgi:lactam utilization protein B